MNVRFYVAMAALSLVGILLLTAAPAQAGICDTAASQMYDRCDLQFRFDGDVFTEAETVAWCGDNWGTTDNACWIGCTNLGNDCGVIADCVDGCFDDPLTCGFTGDLIYSHCENETTDALTSEPMTKTDMIDSCEAAGGQLNNCYNDCAYENAGDCEVMGECIEACENPADDDDTTADDDTTDDDTDDTDDDDTDEEPSESFEQSDGEKLHDVRGSSCGA